MSNSRYSVYFLEQNKPLKSLIRYNKHPKVHYYQPNVYKYLKDQEYFIFNSKISLGRLKMAVLDVRKISVFLQPCLKYKSGVDIGDFTSAKEKLGKMP